MDLHSRRAGFPGSTRGPRVVSGGPPDTAWSATVQFEPLSSLREFFRRHVARTPAIPATPAHASTVIHANRAFPPARHHSGPPSPRAAPAPTYASTHTTHFGMSASSAVGTSQRIARREPCENSARDGDIVGLIVAVVVTQPVHARLRRIFVATLGHEIENRVRAHELLHPASIG